MKGAILTVVSTCLILLLAAGSGFGQDVRGGEEEGESRIGTNAASELLIPVGARYLAMGGAAVATAQGIESIYYNPAGLSRAQYTANAMFSHMTHIADINVNYVAVSASFGGLGTVGLTIKAMDIGDIVVTTEENPDGTGALINPQFLTTGLTYSRAITDRIGVGATLNIITETIDRVGATGVAFNFGIQYRDLANVDGLSIGLAVKNVGPSMQYSGSGLLRRAQPLGSDRQDSPFEIDTQKDELPSTLELGVSYQFAMGETSKLEVTGLFSDNNFQDDTGTFGAEYSFDNLVFVRGGYSFSPDAAEDAAGQSAYIYGLTLGAGLQFELRNLGVSVDYAYRDTDIFDASNVFSVRLGF